MSFLNLEQTFTESAVLVPIFEKLGQLHLILTKRSQTVPHHKGQICFPGGVKEQQDTNLWQTALRETHEEIGLAPKQIYHVDEMQPVYTPTGFSIQPYLGFITQKTQFTLSLDEIDKILQVPLKELVQSERFEKRTVFNKEMTLPVYEFEGEIIWGATARILFELLHIKL